MNFKIIILAFILSISLTACFGLFDSDSDTIIDSYEVLWIDVLANQTISKRVTSTSSYQVVPPYIFSVGHDNNFIIAKQHPSDGFEGDFKIHKSITNYYIIQLPTKDKSIKEDVWGPLTLYQFDSLRRNKKIENIKFNMHYPDEP